MSLMQPRAAENANEIGRNIGNDPAEIAASVVYNIERALPAAFAVASVALAIAVVGSSMLTPLFDPAFLAVPSPKRNHLSRRLSGGRVVSGPNPRRRHVLAHPE